MTYRAYSATPHAHGNNLGFVVAASREEALAKRREAFRVVPICGRCNVPVAEGDEFCPHCAEVECGP